MQQSELSAAARDCEVAAKEQRQRIQLGFSYLSTAESLRRRAAEQQSQKDAAVLLDAAEDLELKAQAILNEVAQPNPATERLLLTAAGFFGVWACPIT